MKLLVTLFLLSFTFSLYSQSSPYIAWDMSLTGSGTEQANYIEHTSDGGYIIGGTDATGQGSVAKMSPSNTVEWVYGFPGIPNAIHQNSDGTFIMAGSTTNSAVAGYRGANDYWIAKVSSIGEIIWSVARGGSFDDVANSIRETSDGNFIVAGYAISNDYDVPNFGNARDFWIIKINKTDGSIMANGSGLWSKVLYGTSDDAAVDIVPTTDGGYFVAGTTQSFDYNFPLNQGGIDIYVYKLDANGNIAINPLTSAILRRNLGGSANDVVKSVVQTSDGGYIVAGGTRSTNGNVVGNHGNSDAWIVKLRSDLTIERRTCYGGTAYDVANQVINTTDGGIIVIGSTESSNGDVTGFHGASDGWMFKISSIGALQWQKTIGGTLADNATSIDAIAPNEYIIACNSFSSDGDITTNNGGSDWVVVKTSMMYMVDPALAEIITTDGKINPNLSGLNFRSNNVTGACTDGLTKVLFVTESKVPIKFDMLLPNNGKFSTLQNQDVYNTTYTIPTNPTTYRTGIIYNVPDGYGELNPVGGRNIEINVTLGTHNNKIIFRLVTPPVVLVHGMWSAPKTAWQDTKFEDYLRSNGFSNIQLADYKDYNYQTYDPYNDESQPGRSAIYNAILKAIDKAKSEKIAMTQVDVVGHSLGGLMTRSFSQWHEVNITKRNYSQGYIHKLITIGTPHLGTPLGPLLYYSDNWLRIFDPNSLGIIGYISLEHLLYKIILNKIGSCHRDFDTDINNNPALQNLHPTNLDHIIKVHAIVGIDEGVNEDLGTIKSFIRLLAQSSGELAKFDLFLNTDQHDLIVGKESQLGGLPSNGSSVSIFPATSHSSPPGFLSYTETSNPLIQEKVRILLKSSDASLFANGFPAPSQVLQGQRGASQGQIVPSNVQPYQSRISTMSSGDSASIRLTPSSRGLVINNQQQVTIAFDTLNGAKIKYPMCLIEGLGWQSFPENGSYTITISTAGLKNKLGKISYFVLARDTSGILLVDTSYFIVPPKGNFYKLQVQQDSIRLDSLIKEEFIKPIAIYTSGTDTFKYEVDTSYGVSYSVLRGKVIIRNNSVQALSPGLDSLIVSYSGQSDTVKVKVDSNFMSVPKFTNTINFNPLNKKLSDHVFALSSTASSGQEVTYQLISGPIQLNNGVAVITDIGTVTIKVSSPATVYFDSAVSVTKSFLITSSTYTFIGNGNWNNAANWIGNLVPPSALPQGIEVIINPTTNGECILNVPITIPRNGKLTVATGKKFTINGNLTVVQQ